MNLTKLDAQCSGKFIFSPKRPGLKKSHRAFDNAIILKVDNGISEYYSWWIHRKYGIELAPPAWGTHVTVVSDRDRVTDLATFEALKNSFNGKILSLPHAVDIYKKWQFWILDVSPTCEMVEIRKSLGLNPDYPFHITIGRDDCVQTNVGR